MTLDDQGNLELVRLRALVTELQAEVARLELELERHRTAPDPAWQDEAQLVLF
jgi:hypothetical protein